MTEKCTCLRQLDGGLMPRPKGLPLPIIIIKLDPNCPKHGHPSR